MKINSNTTDDELIDICQNYPYNNGINKEVWIKIIFKCIKYNKINLLYRYLSRQCDISTISSEFNIFEHDFILYLNYNFKKIIRYICKYTYIYIKH